MSQMADLIDTFSTAPKRYGIGWVESANLFIEVMADLGWDLDDYIEIDYADPDWRQQEVSGVMHLLLRNSQGLN